MFDRDKVCIYKQQEIAPQKTPIITGHRNPSTRLWELKIPHHIDNYTHKIKAVRNQHGWKQ